MRFAAHGISHIHRVITDNGACYRSYEFARIVGIRTRHQRTRPYTPRHNGKAERYQRIMAEEVLYAREYNCEDERSAALEVWNIHYNYHRPHSAAGGRPPASRLKTGVTNVRTSYKCCGSSQLRMWVRPARRMPGRGRGLPKMKVPTPLIWKMKLTRCSGHLMSADLGQAAAACAVCRASNCAGEIWPREECRRRGL